MALSTTFVKYKNSVAEELCIIPAASAPSFRCVQIVSITDTANLHFSGRRVFHT